MSAQAPPSAIDPEVFLAIDDLELVGRGLADAVWSGRHLSRRRGQGTEFHTHRTYRAGDDLRRVNWALYARHKKLYTKESRHESYRPLHLLLDATASMSVSHGPWSKFHYAVRVAAGLAHLARAQSDVPAVGFLRAGLCDALPPRGGAGHLATLCAALTAARAEGPGDLVNALEEARSLCVSRGFIVVISDFFEKEELLLEEMSRWRAHGHDVFALQLLDPLEVRLPSAGDYEFLDVETGASLRSSVEDLHENHAAAVAAWREDLRRRALDAGIHWRSATTADPIIEVLRDWLSR